MITITNGKALYEGLEIENFAECQPLEGIHFRNKDFPLKWEYKDGTYPLPEGWGVVKEYFIYDNTSGWIQVARHRPIYKGRKIKTTARLVRKQQNSAHGYTEGSELDQSKPNFNLNRDFPKEELRKEFIDYYVNKREDQSMLDSLNHLFEKYYSQLKERDRQIEELKNQLSKFISGPSKQTVELKSKSDNLI